MTPYYQRDGITLYHGDCRDVLADLADSSFDAVITDPPYDLTAVSRGGSARTFVDNPFGRTRVGTDRGFMGKTWDGTGIAFSVELWREILRVLKPGAHVCAFGGARTYHRMVVAMEDAGFEIRDSIHWIYGTGFPKSLNLGAGRGTALKPAHEPIVLARKPLAESTVAANVARWGAGALNVDGCRIPGAKHTVTRGPRVLGGVFHPQRGQGRIKDDGRGRWPPNVALTHASGPGCPVAALDQQSGDCGGASRFFPVSRWDEPDADPFLYCAKAARSEREAGCEALPRRTEGVWGGEADDLTEGKRAMIPRANIHPTVKPIELMRWLCRLITPPGGHVLEPFLGSGSTAIAAVRERLSLTGIEREAEYAEIARARIDHAINEATRQTSLFDVRPLRAPCPPNDPPSAGAKEVG